MIEVLGFLRKKSMDPEIQNLKEQTWVWKQGPKNRLSSDQLVIQWIVSECSKRHYDECHTRIYKNQGAVCLVNPQSLREKKISYWPGIHPSFNMMMSHRYPSSQGPLISLSPLDPPSYPGPPIVIKYVIEEEQSLMEKRISFRPGIHPSFNVISLLSLSPLPPCYPPLRLSFPPPSLWSSPIPTSYMLLKKSRA